MTKRILVAEDDLEDRDGRVMLLELSLEEIDVEVLVAATRQEALDIIAECDDLSVVMTDLRMPEEGDGEAVAKTALDKGIKVIVLSGTVRDLSKETSSRCHAVFTKPCEPRKLIESVREVLAA